MFSSRGATATSLTLEFLFNEKILNNTMPNVATTKYPAINCCLYLINCTGLKFKNDIYIAPGLTINNFTGTFVNNSFVSRAIAKIVGSNKKSFSLTIND